MKWTRGQQRVDGLLAEGRLEVVTGADADGGPWLVSAQALLESAKRETDANPEAAYVLGHDAARKASTALLAQQGLRTKSAGHHFTVEQVVRAQFGGPFDGFGALRRRRVTRRPAAGKLDYRASVAQWKADLVARRPKAAKLATSERLREYVQERLPGHVCRPDGTPGARTDEWAMVEANIATAPPG